MGGMRGGTLELPEERAVGQTIRLNPAEEAALDRLQERLGARTRSDAVRALLGGWLRSGQRVEAVPEREREAGPRRSIRFSAAELDLLGPSLAAAGSFARLLRIAVAWAAGLKAREWQKVFGGRRG
jgi:hypothetical protein